MSYVEAVVDSVWFGQQIRSTQIRARKLHKKVKQAEWSDSSMNQEAKRCAERLQKLVEYAERHSLMSSTDHRIALETSWELEEIQALIRERRSWLEKLWEAFLDWIAQAISFVRELLAIIVPKVPILPSGLRETIVALLVAPEIVKGLLPGADTK
jgi:hypothetical protein